MEKPFFVFHGTEKILPIPRKNESKQKNGFPVLINAYVRFFFCLKDKNQRNDGSKV